MEKNNRGIFIDKKYLLNQSNINKGSSDASNPVIDFSSHTGGYNYGNLEQSESPKKT